MPLTGSHIAEVAQTLEPKPHVPHGPRPTNPVFRFFDRVLIGDDCWEWTGYKAKDGYGRFQIWPANTRQAHVYAYEWFVGPIPEGLVLDHLCRNRGCVNPQHLEAVTMRENVIRGLTIVAANAAKTHCVNGHEFTEANTYRWGSHRQCRVCMAERSRIKSERRKAQRHARGLRRRR